MIQMENNKNYFEPKDMPAFLNDLAVTYFKDNEEIMMKLAECSIYIHVVNTMMGGK